MARRPAREGVAEMITDNDAIKRRHDKQEIAQLKALLRECLLHLHTAAQRNAAQEALIKRIAEAAK